MPKGILDCGNNKVSVNVPVNGFGMGPTRAKAKSAAMDMALAFANAIAAAEFPKWQCPEGKGCPNKRGPIVANLKTTELTNVKLQEHLYLSVVQRTFDVVIVCQGG
jgi:hypothetical protein